MTDKDFKLLEEAGWTVECEDPLEIRYQDGSFATGVAAYSVVHNLRLEKLMVFEGHKCKKS